MSIATFIGIDLAWRSRNPTGVAVLKGNKSGAQLKVVTSLTAEDSISEFIRSHSTADTIVAIDAPLIIINKTGQRQCETEVGRRYSNREASCHTSNLTLFSKAASVALTKHLLADGFVHANPKQRQRGEIVAEVYPHAAMVALWDLPKTIKYKKGRVAQRLEGLAMLRSKLVKLTKATPALLPSRQLKDLLYFDLTQLRGRKRKDYEDQLDALFCAYLAFYFWHWRDKRTHLFGDTECGYILNPILQPSKHRFSRSS